MNTDWRGWELFEDGNGVFPGVEVNDSLRNLSWPISGKPTEEFAPELNIVPGPQQTVRVRVNRKTHLKRYEDESEEFSTVVFEPKVIEPK